MNDRAARLLLVFLAVPGLAVAQVSARAPAAIPAAPLPIAVAIPAAPNAVSFSATSLNAAPFAAPALLPAAAAPAGSAAVPDAPALAALPAAAPGEGPSGELAAKAAGDAAFDGASVPTDAEIAALYAAARPGSRTIATLGKRGGFAGVANDLVMHYTFDWELVDVLRESPEAFGPDGRRYIKAVKELTAVADARDDPAARRFLQALGRRTAARYLADEALRARSQAAGFASRRDGVERRSLPRNDLGSGDYWDMASGVNAGDFILHELEPGTRYSFFDRSPFVASFLSAVSASKGAAAVAIEADVMTLKRPARPLAVLRTKNAVVYVPGFEDKLTEMAEWIAPGGSLAIQNDPESGQREDIVNKHAALARSLIARGWSFRFEFTSARGAEHALDTLIFTRPKGAPVPRSPAEARETWERYVSAVERTDRREGFY